MMMIPGPTRDIYTEPADIDLHTFENLGPLTPLAGSWEGGGIDHHPVRDGGENEGYLEKIEFHPIDPQPNGPQLLYGLRYHVHIKKPGEANTFHDQVGYWLWEPATKTLIQTIAIPRGQVLMASGVAEPDAITITVNADGTFTYEQDTVLQIAGRPDPFHHTDRNTLRKVSEAVANPAAA